ncbi:MAG: hypothetical protein ABIW82_07565 [Dokdonella sp.]
MREDQKAAIHGRTIRYVFLRSSFNAKIKRRPSWTHYSVVFAFVLEREDQTAAIHRRTIQKFSAFFLERKDQTAAIHGRTIQ